MKPKKCPYCKSKEVILFGKPNGVQRFKCKNCNKLFLSTVERESIFMANKIYKDYVNGNNTIHYLATHFKIHPTILYRWLDIKFWQGKQESKNKFRAVAKNKYFVCEIESFFEDMKPRIKVKAQYSNVVIQFLYKGLATESVYTYNLFTLYRIREKEDGVFCSVKFNIFSHVKRISTPNGKKYNILDFIENKHNICLETESDVMKFEQSQVLYNISINDFLNIISDKERVELFLDVLIDIEKIIDKRKLNYIKIQEHGKDNFEKIKQKVRDIRNEKHKK